MDKPRRPGKNAGEHAWDMYHAAMADWKVQQGTSMRSSWTPASSQPPDVGVIAGTDHVASFKTKDDRTIIADGDYSDDPKGFNRSHNDYGPRQESPGDYFDEDRGHYTGPGH